MKFRWALVLPLAVAQLVSWGSLYYAFAVVSGPMAAELGWSSPQVNGALSAGLATTGLASFFAGRIIDVYGGRLLMTFGSIAGAFLLFAWSHISELWQLYAVWIAMGAVFSCVLYEPAFAVMARELKEDYRRGIITITLLGGLASTVFIPLTHFLVEAGDWRYALLVLAVLQIPFGVLIHWLVLPKTLKVGTGEQTIFPKGRVSKAMATPLFWLLALSYASHAFMFTGLIFHIIPLLTERGFSLPTVIAAYTLVGPFQVIGRVVVFALERRINVKLAGIIATSLPVIGMVSLMLATPGSPILYCFAVFYGAGMGIKTIVQATAGPEFLGREGYGALQGTFAGINYTVQAGTPFAVAMLWSMMGGYDQVVWVLFAGAVLSALAFIGAIAISSKSEIVVQS
jgi:predicted MFS family arabinose efflux permease